MAFLQEKMRELVAIARVVPISCRVMLSRDPNDDHYLSLCKETKADFLITGDKDLLLISAKALQKNGIMTRIVTPHYFLSEE
jgi:predicted nucleic acid-binding protein